MQLVPVHDYYTINNFNLGASMCNVLPALYSVREMFGGPQTRSGQVMSNLRGCEMVDGAGKINLEEEKVYLVYDISNPDAREKKCLSVNLWYVDVSETKLHIKQLKEQLLYLKDAEGEVWPSNSNLPDWILTFDIRS